TTGKTDDRRRDGPSPPPIPALPPLGETALAAPHPQRRDTARSASSLHAKLRARASPSAATRRARRTAPRSPQRRRTAARLGPGERKRWTDGGRGRWSVRS